ncbi:MAG: hypothetical protein JSU58_03140 [Dehalococcoidales bacterium]|nr:MAG: hypothetical protein JSU58_03140 [Dehalococcoidales bacterium]
MSDTTNRQYEVLSPWAVVDPIPLRGLAPRLDNLDGKTIGLFKNFKRAAGPILEVVEKELQARYPASKFIWFNSNAANVLETETENREEFQEWVKGIDAAVTSVGD